MNKEFIRMVNGEEIVLKKDIAKMLKVSRPTLDKWIKEGFISSVKSEVMDNTSAVFDVTRL